VSSCTVEPLIRGEYSELPLGCAFPGPFAGVPSVLMSRLSLEMLEAGRNTPRQAPR
jgi:hypothetical protein